MKFKIKTPDQAIEIKKEIKTFLPNEDEIIRFKKELKTLVDKIEIIDKRPIDETEEHLKTDLRDFLMHSVYSRDEYSINTKGKIDLAIYLGNNTDENIGVIIEAKRPKNKVEMISFEDLNRKAFHELILYYFDERIKHKNSNLKYLIITNVLDWYIIDVNNFEEKIFNKKLKDEYENCKNDEKKNPYFYEEAKNIITSIDYELPCIHFNIKEYAEFAKNDTSANSKKIINLYKILSPNYLLKQQLPNNSNKLNDNFYKELLHIIGVEELPEGGKNLIKRKKIRDNGSFLENTINILETEDSLRKFTHLYPECKTKEDKIYTIALELVLTWINRILFLKLLEGQLLSYHINDAKKYKFLYPKKIKDFDEIYKLFHQVLARNYNERHEQIKKEYEFVPYLNSSLFEISELEDLGIKINSLDDNLTIPVFNKTKTDFKGHQLNPLEYLLEFLNAYTFGSDKEDETNNDKLINASVLGDIFEKINGYKDGSFYTPGFITEYMCKETIERAVVQKFNEVKGWSCEDFTDLCNKDLDENLKETNSIIDSIKICDPAVGSGHFLVSALNQMIVIKHELKVLVEDRTANKWKKLKGVTICILNDELNVKTDGDIFKYNPKRIETLVIQKALFEEKQTIIENCLFGVDINSNSVKICRLRLWIELLKNAYYIKGLNGEPDYLETLPNIDINIKCGNSLISRFGLDTDLKEALRKSNLPITTYKEAVNQYRNAENKEQKREMEALIEKIKTNFRSEIASNDPKLAKLYKLKGELTVLNSQTGLFELSKKETIELNKKSKSLTEEVKKLDTDIEEIKSNKIYENAFEWRFEFPEVLNDIGDFVGFDIVIGNPPYMRVQEIQNSQPSAKVFYDNTYYNAKGAYDLANIFFELAINISNKKSNNAYIFPHKFFNSSSADIFRDYLIKGKFIDSIAHFGANMIFEDADTYTCIAQFSKSSNSGFNFQRFAYKSDYKNLMLQQDRFDFINYENIIKASKLYGNNQWIMFDNPLGFSVFEKIYTNFITLENYLDGIFVGLQTSKDELYVLENGTVKNNLLTALVPISNKEYELELDLFKPFLMGKDVHRFSDLKTSKYVFFPYKIENNKAVIVSENDIKNNYPKTYLYLTEHEKQFKARESGKAGKMQHWHAYIYPKNLNKFEQQKLSSMEICAIKPNVTLNSNNFYHTTKVYSWVKKEDVKESYEYLLAIANSQLLWWFLKLTGDTLQGDARTFKTNYLNPFPLPLDVNNKLEDEIKKRVLKVLEHKKQDPKLNSLDLEKEIDALVYKLYNLSYEEVLVVDNEFTMTKEAYEI
jgi:adenine-specific DNA-methyltransferase